MAIKVKCPNGCLLRVPNKRRGEIFRCPQCKSSIQAGSVLPTDVNSDVPVIEAQFADSSFPGLEIDVEHKPTNAQMAGRVERAIQDRMLIARFLAIFIGTIGAINLVPAIYHWNYWVDDTITSTVPRWIYLQIVVAALMLIYSVFLWQIQDWSSLKVVAVLAMFLSAGYAFVVTALVVGNVRSEIAIYLGISFSILRTATIWCVAMLLVSIATSWLSIREALSWQRIEKVFNEIAFSDSKRKV